MSKLTGSKKATQFTESVIREMTRLNQLYGGVNLSQGFPDFPAPAAIKDAACAAINADVNQYAVTWGARPLREAVAREFTRRYGLPVVADEQVTVCCGSTEAMMATMMAIIDPGDEVVIFEPFYENYGPDAILSGATPRYVTLHEPDWTLRSRRARRGVQRQDEGDHHQHAEQPDRQGVHARRARDDRRAVPQVGRDRDLRRDLRAHHLRRPPAHADGDDRGDGRSDDHDQRPVEDLQRDRLARRLDDLAAVADRRDPQGARLPDRRRRRRRCRRRAPSRSACRTTYYAKLAADYQRRRDVLLDILERHHFTVLQAVRRVLHHDRHQRVRLRRRCRVRALPGEGRRRGGGARQQLLQDRGAGRTKLRFCFCKKDETLAEADRRMEKLVPAGVR